jgi:hypothetical protein
MSLTVTRNVVSDEDAERGRTHGGYTFNAFPPDDYEGLLLVVACVRLGDHAHLDVSSGRAGGAKIGWRPTTLHYGRAGRLILRWPEWLKLRELLDSAPWVRIAEVERPTDEQLREYGAI